MSPRILALYYDPAANGQRMSARYNWVQPTVGLQAALEQLNGAMAGSGIVYTMDMQEIAIPALTRRTYQSQHVDHVDSTPPVYLSPESWVENWDALAFQPSKWPSGGEIHIKQFFADNNIIARVNAGEIDEVWTAGLPIPACFEGAMVAPWGQQGAYPAHDTLIYVSGLQRRFVWAMLSIENWNPLHNYFHRIEAIMSRIWAGPDRDPGYGLGYAEQWSPPRSMDTVKTTWHLWSLTDNERPGEAQVGSGHFMPNTKLGYVSNHEDVVPSGHKLWLNYPNGFPLDLSRTDRFDLVSVEDWRGRPDYIWQYEHIPRGPGVHDGRYCNWWKYLTNVNEEFGRNTPTTRPWTGTPPPLPGAVTEYPSLGRALIRWSPREGDPPDAVYEVRADGVLRGTLRRRAEVHTKLSMDVPIAQASYSVARLGAWSETYPRSGPVPAPPPAPEPGGNVLLSKAEIAAIVHEMHTTQQIFFGFPEPSGYDEDAGNVIPYWLTEVHGRVQRVIQRHWTIAQIKQFYAFMYPYDLLRDGVIVPAPAPVPSPPPPPVINPQLTVQQITQIVDALHTLPVLMGCPKPWAYRQDSATKDFTIHWQGQPPMLIDKDWSVGTVQSFYTAMYPRAICGGVTPVPVPPVPVPVPVPPVPTPTPTPTPGASFDVRPLVDTVIASLDAAAAVWRAFRGRL